MHLRRVRGGTPFVRNAILLLLPLFLLSMGPRFQTGQHDSDLTVRDLLRSPDPFDRIVHQATIQGLAGREAYAVCLHPDTRPEDKERLLRELPTYPGDSGLLGYWLRGRWSWTATDGNTGTTGDPITITWGIVPDGTWADGGASDLQTVFTAHWGSTGWLNKIRNAFDRWEAVIGVTYVEVSDDGANMPNNGGQLGVRGDVRIGGRSIDGPSNVLAYNYYPSAGGDMILDTDDVTFFGNPTYNYANLKNTVCHEHGHGLGFGHVIPEDCTKLMEATHCGGNHYVGPQDDDIRGAMRNYGDPYENNDTNADPSVLGTVVDTMVVENLSIDRGTSDVDWYQVTVTETGIVVEVDPVGSYYELGNEGGSTSWIATDSISDPDIELYDVTGTSLLASATSAGIGETEVLTHTVGSAGSYQIKVFRKAASGNGVQRYTMTIYYDDQSGVPTDRLPRTGLELAASPNPFSRQTTARFFAPAAGGYSVQVYDVSGRLVREIEGHASKAGWVEAVWDGRDSRGVDAASGMYFMRAAAGKRVDTKRVLMVR